MPAPAMEESKSIYFLKYYFIYVSMLGKLALLSLDDGFVSRRNSVVFHWKRYFSGISLETQNQMIASHQTRT